MRSKTISSREFNQDASGAKRATEGGPVFITDRGRPAHVLLTFDAYQKLVSARPSAFELLAQPDGSEIEFEPARLASPLTRTADLG
jgi:prevent-host-death family protein